MNSDPPVRYGDAEFNADLEAVRSAWSRLEQSEPPELIDQAVLNSAKRQLEASRKRLPLRWLGGLATAAIVVLTLAIVVRQDEQTALAPMPDSDGFRLEQGADRPEEADRAVLLQDEPIAETRFMQKAPTAAAATPEAREAPRQEAGQPSAQALEHSETVPDPDLWIERILELRASGDAEQLEAELEAFRRAFPDYPLPPELLE